MYACVYKDQRQKKNTNTTRDEEKETINTPRQRELNYNKKKNRLQCKRALKRGTIRAASSL